MLRRSATAEATPRRSGRPGAQDIDRHVGARVRERRIMLGLTQQELAGLVGITYQQAHKYEKGLNRIAAGRLHALARALGVEPGYFFEGLGEPARPTAQQRLLLELARSFAALPRRQQEAITELARVLAVAEAEAAPGQEKASDATRTTVAPALPSSEAA
jgi:transcriptional regulator with XRE-family HTH domain